MTLHPERLREVLERRLTPPDRWWAFFSNPRNWRWGRYQSPSGNLRVWQVGPLQRGKWEDTQ